jgi:hypothetical protein
VVMYVYMYIVLFCRYTNHVFVCRITRDNHGVECELPLTMRTPPIYGESFSFGEEWIGPTYCHGIAFMCCIITK